MDFSKMKRERNLDERIPDIERQVDQLLRNEPDELKQVRENDAFMDAVERDPIPKEKAGVRVFNAKTVNLNAVLKKNILGRNIFVVDELIEMFLTMTLEDLIKFRKKKRPLSFDSTYLIMLVIGVPVVIVILMILFGG